MNPSRLVAVGYGTRPQVIKAARLLPALREQFDTLAIDTGQHYDYELNALLYEQLRVPAPDALLDVGSAPRAEQLARIEASCGAVLGSARPQVMVVIGDTNSTLGCARAAHALGIPVVHVEAGLRSHVPQMAEEMNRIEVDHLAAVLCAPSRAAMVALETEGISGRACLTGDIARDALEFAVREGLPAPGPDWPIDDGTPYLFATIHRAELTDDAHLLSDVIGALAALPVPVVLALHPRTRDRLAPEARVSRRGALHVIGPLGYLDSLAAIRGAHGVVTDSGGVQREAYWLGVPCVTLRRETEWTETVTLGANRLVDPASSRTALAIAVEKLRPPGPWDRNEYGNGAAAEAILNAIATMSALSEAPAHDH